MPKLYELTSDAKELEHMVESGDVTQDMINDTLNLISMDFEEKAVDIVRVIKNADTTPLKDEIKRLQAMVRTAENRKDWLKDYLRENMAAMGISKIDRDMVKISLRKAKDKLIVDDEDSLPDDYITIVTATKVIDAKLKEDLDNGVEIEGARLEKAKQALVIS